MGAVVLRQDYYGHTQQNNNNSAANLVGAAVSTTAIGTIVGTTAAGAAPTVTFGTGQRATDMAGTFTLTPVTGGGSQAAGAVAQIFFQNSFEVAPAGVTVGVVDQAAGSSAVAVAAAASTITATGFTVNVSAALTTAHLYTISYIVAP
jgi:hypothetical protein